ncbi:MAG: hypothetical protein ACD_22C00081G0009 [uncultured bacterium]|nr:MAG: hypothetical protein ACD_22C00081G0009 [uncultured bacterium]
MWKNNKFQLKIWIYSLIAKAIYLTIRVLNKGNGYTWPGHFILKIQKNVLKDLSQVYPKGIILISGTNGKTTTSKVLSHIFDYLNVPVSTNKSGANLENGLVSGILLDTDMLGMTRKEYGVFEVDEFVLPKLLEHVSPTALLLLNLSRDQLDRYGETDIIFDKWKSAIAKLDASCFLVLDCEQKEFYDLHSVFKGRVFYFDADPALAKLTHLNGTFNAKNVNAACLTMSVLGYDHELVTKSLENFSVAYGRGELIEKNNTTYQLFLAKNPASFNHNLQMLSENTIDAKNLLFVLNDNIPDGRDVSWIYDVNPDLLKKVCNGKEVFVSGTRALDMAVRLMYAGVTVLQENVYADLNQALNAKTDGLVVILPNYSAMLEVRKFLIGRNIL